MWRNVVISMATIQEMWLFVIHKFLVASRKSQVTSRCRGVLHTPAKSQVASRESQVGVGASCARPPSHKSQVELAAHILQRRLRMRKAFPDRGAETDYSDCVLD
jgi:hypothetical protein